MSLSLSSDFHMWVEEGKVLQAQESKKKKNLATKQCDFSGIYYSAIFINSFFKLTVIYDNAF